MYARIIAIAVAAIGIGTLRNGADAKVKPLFASKPGLMSGDSITLVWSPHDSIGKGLLVPIAQCEYELTIQEVKDSRGDKAYLAKNTEGKEIRNVYLKSDFASWVKSRLDTCVSGKCSGISKENRYLLWLDIDRFDITESDMYRCSLEVEITIKGADSTVLQKQKISSDADMWGRSFNEKSYSSAASNAVIQIANALLSLDVFKKYMGPAKQSEPGLRGLRDSTD